MANSILKCFGIFGIAVGAIATGVAVCVTYQAKKVCDKVDSRIDDISSDIDVAIPEAIINAAIKKSN